MPLKIEKITDPLTLGEGPHWDDRQQALLFVDILACTIHKYVLSSKKHTKTKLGNIYISLASNTSILKLYFIVLVIVSFWFVRRSTGLHSTGGGRNGPIYNRFGVVLCHNTMGRRGRQPGEGSPYISRRRPGRVSQTQD